MATKVLIACFNKNIAEELKAKISMLDQMPYFKLSSYQQTFVDFVLNGQGNGIVQAVAGSGKTTTIMQGMKYLKEKYADLAIKTSTTHSQGFYSIKNQPVFKGGKVDVGKVSKLVSPYFFGKGTEFDKIVVPKMNIPKGEVLSFKYEHLGLVNKLVSLAKNKGVGIKGVGEDLTPDTLNDLIEYYQILPFDLEVLDKIDVEWIVEKAIEVFTKSLTNQSVVDFDDMLYHPVFYNYPLETFDFIFVDECQDTNPLTQVMMKRSLKPTGRCIGVGDVAQAIYGFRGADAEAMEKFKTSFNATEMPLSLCYRSGKNIIEKAKILMPQIEALPNAPVGILENIGKVSQIDSEDFALMFDSDSAIICRKNAPLIQMCFKLLIKGVIPQFLGRDDLEKDLIGNLNKKKQKNLNKPMKISTY